MSTPSESHDYVGDQPPKAAKLPLKAAPGITLRTLLKPVASLQLTVVLFALSLILIFFGTLAQQHASIERVVGTYFRAWIVFIPFDLISDFLRVFFAVDIHIPGKFPFPGGYIIGWAMFCNLLAAHLLRFKLTWKRLGIFMLHLGVIVLLLGEFLTAQLAVETQMHFNEGESANYTVSLHEVELAVVDTSNPESDTVVIVPDNILVRNAGKDWISNPDLPFDVKVLKYFVNTNAVEIKDAKTNLADKGIGTQEELEPRPETKGTDSDGRINYPGAYIELRDKGGNRLGSYLVSLNHRSQPVTVDDKTYQIALRLKRTYKPYSIELVKAEHKVYAGTNTPKDYASTVMIHDPEFGDRGPIRIWMNHPMYYRGEVFYQSQMQTDPKTGVKRSGLQVVKKNISWLKLGNRIMPVEYVGCFLITLGMGVHFVIRLISFLQRRAK